MHNYVSTSPGTRVHKNCRRDLYIHKEIRRHIKIHKRVFKKKYSLRSKTIEKKRWFSLFAAFKKLIETNGFGFFSLSTFDFSMYNFNMLKRQINGEEK